MKESDERRGGGGGEQKGHYTRCRNREDNKGVIKEIDDHYERIEDCSVGYYTHYFAMSDSLPYYFFFQQWQTK